MTAGSVLGGPPPPLEKRQLQGDVPATKQLSARPHLLVVPLFMDCGDCQESPHAERERRTKSEAEVWRKCRTVELSLEAVDEGNCSWRLLLAYSLYYLQQRASFSYLVTIQLRPAKPCTPRRLIYPFNWR